MTLDELIKQNSPDDEIDTEAIDEVAELIGGKLIPEVIRIADKYNYDRDSMVKCCADIYSTMAEVATFENWKGDENKIDVMFSELDRSMECVLESDHRSFSNRETENGWIFDHIIAWRKMISPYIKR